MDQRTKNTNNKRWYNPKVLLCQTQQYIMYLVDYFSGVKTTF